MFAYLFGPPKHISRKEALRVFDGVCEALGYDDFQFQYGADNESKQSTRVFTVVMTRKEGRGGLRIGLKNDGPQNPIVLQIDYTWPPSVEVAKEHFDTIAGSVRERWPGEFQCPIAEARVKAQCGTASASALEFMLGSAINTDSKRIEGLGDALTFSGLRFESVTDLDGINLRREIDIQTLREDPKDLYIEVMSQWNLGALKGMVLIVPDGDRAIPKPSECVQNVLDFITKRVVRVVGGADK